MIGIVIIDFISEFPLVVVDPMYTIVRYNQLITSCTDLISKFNVLQYKPCLYKTEETFSMEYNKEKARPPTSFILSKQNHTKQL